MIITICGSMVFAKEMLAMQQELESIGHTAYVSDFCLHYLDKGIDEQESLAIKHKQHDDAIKAHYEKIKKSDSILVLNYEKRGVVGYIGGNTLMELGFAHVLDKKIFLLHTIPDLPYSSEIRAVNPIILEGANPHKIR